MCMALDNVISIILVVVKCRFFCAKYFTYITEKLRSLE